MRTNRFVMELSLSDQVRLGKAMKEMDTDAVSAVIRLVHDFFASEGVKNLTRSIKSSRKFSHV